MRWLVAPIIRDIAPSMDGTYSFDRKDYIQAFFVDSNTAHEYARNRAVKSPGLVMAVFKIETVYETTTPNILEKVINSSGELVLRPIEPTNG